MITTIMDTSVGWDLIPNDGEPPPLLSVYSSGVGDCHTGLHQQNSHLMVFQDQPASTLQSTYNTPYAMVPLQASLLFFRGDSSLVFGHMVFDIYFLLLLLLQFTHMVAQPFRFAHLQLVEHTHGRNTCLLVLVLGPCQWHTN